MLALRSVVAEVTRLSTLKTLANVYGEIASMKMRKAREGVLHSRRFLEQIGIVFDEVRASHLDRVLKLSQKKTLPYGERVTTLSHNGKTVAVLLSANTKLYGDLVQRTFEAFVEDTVKDEVEAVVVGKVGMGLFRVKMPTKPVTYFDYPDDGNDREALAAILKHLVQYEEIHVFYGKFSNVLTQRAEKYVMTAGMPLSSKKEKGEMREYLFEPSLEAVLGYFEKEIFGTLFGQTIDESQLAKHASRLVAMDRAEVNIDKRLETLQIEELKSRHRNANRKQLNAMSGVLARLR
jgi:F-type H+-transporting ATPase subunit gamma